MRLNKLICETRNFLRWIWIRSSDSAVFVIIGVCFDLNKKDARQIRDLMDSLLQSDLLDNNENRS